jgi:acetyl-CoA synthetase
MTADYATLRQSFAWSVPEHFNIAAACLARWAEGPRRCALIWEDESGATWTLDYQDLDARSRRLASRLVEWGVQPGDRVAVILSQRPETVAAHMAAFWVGAIVVPLTVQFGAEALRARLLDASPLVIVFEEASAGALNDVLADWPQPVRLVAVAGGQAPEAIPWVDALLAGHEAISPYPTRASDPAVLIYTSGTTGPPKGALMPHSVVLGNLPGFDLSHDDFARHADPAAPPTRRFYSPADWAWTGGLMDVLYPVLYYGQTVVAYRGRFDAEKSLALMARYRVTNTFLFPTALKMIMKAVPHPRQHHALVLESIMSGGEALGATVYRWAEDELGISINEIFGQTEANYIVGNSSRHWPAKPGSMGRPYPGHRVALLDEDGQPLPVGKVGEVAVHRYWTSDTDTGTRNPVLLLAYWQQPKASTAKFRGDWCCTGDLAYADADGDLWYVGRADDVFKSAGYRIGPAEIENCLVGHPAVANAAVVGKPDAERGQIVKAFVVLAEGYSRSAELAEALQEHVRHHLAPYQCPREISFVDALPLTTTGKVQRRFLRERSA